MSRSSKSAVATKAAPKNNRSRKAAPALEPIATHGEAISVGMKELADVRTKMRAKRDGTPAKQLIFSDFYKQILSGKKFDAETTARKYPEVKESSIRSWVSHWTRHAGSGDNGFPANARSKDIQSKLKAAIKKALVA